VLAEAVALSLRTRSFGSLGLTDLIVSGSCFFPWPGKMP
jgi:hypothetical protein